MNKKALKQLFAFIVLYNWALSIGLIIVFIPIWNELNLLFHILLITLGVTVILEIPIFIFIIWKEMKSMILYTEDCMKYVEAVRQVEILHDIRYKMYLIGDTQDVEEYTEKIQKDAQYLARYGESMLERNGFTQKQRQQIQDGIQELEYLQNNVQPKNRAL